MTTMNAIPISIQLISSLISGSPWKGERGLSYRTSVCLRVAGFAVANRSPRHPTITTVTAMRFSVPRTPAVQIIAGIIPAEAINAASRYNALDIRLFIGSVVIDVVAHLQILGLGTTGGLGWGGRLAGLVDGFAEGWL